MDEITYDFLWMSVAPVRLKVEEAGGPVGGDGFGTHALEGVVVGLDDEDGGAGGVCVWPRC